MALNLRKLHRKIAPILFLPLLASALTGVAYRLGRSWFNVSGDTAEVFLVIHQGEYLGEPLTQIYVLLTGLGLLGLIVTGLTMIRSWNQRSELRPASLNNRKLHRYVGILAFLPLAVSAITGVGFRLGKDWFGLSQEQTALLLRIHQGTYLGQFFRVIYVGLIGLGLIIMLISGIRMLRLVGKRQPQPEKEHNYR